MPTVEEAYNYYKKAMKDGKKSMRTGHPYIAEEEASKREKNAPDPITGKVKTKIAFDSQDEDSYREWHKERARWMKLANKNPTLSTDAMIIRLRLASDEEINEILAAVGEQRARLEAERHNPLVPKAVIPHE